MKKLAIVLLSYFIVSCDIINVFRNDESPNFIVLPVEVISLPGVDIMNVGGTYTAVVRTESEYLQLLDEKFQTPLNNYCNQHFQGERERIQSDNPSWTDEEVQEKLNELCIERTAYFNAMNLKNAKHPEIDFSEFTLLGQDAHGGGCEVPDYDITISGDGDIYTFHITVTMFGTCSMAINRNVWVLVPRIDEAASIRFTKEYVQND